MRTRSLATRLALPLSRSWWHLPLLIYVVSRVVDGVIIAIVAQHQIGMSPDDVHLEVPMPPAPGYLTATTNWDGQWYYTIAEHGYPHELPRNDGQVVQNAWAFYPVFPALARAVMTVSGASFPLAATLINVVAAGFAIVLLYRLLLPRAGRFNASLVVAALCGYAAAPALQVAYTEALALLLLVLALTFLIRRRYGWYMAVILVVALTRPIVLPLAAVVVWHWWRRWRGRSEEPFSVRDRWIVAGVGVGTVSSFALWPLATAVVTGEANAYGLTQRAWPAAIGHETAPWPSWLDLMLGGTTLLPAILIALLLLVLTVLRPGARIFQSELRVWALVYSIYLLVAAQAATSIIRYAMLALICWWPFTVSATRSVRPQFQYLAVAGVLLVGFATQYVWVDWLYIPHSTCFAPADLQHCYP